LRLGAELRVQVVFDFARVSSQVLVGAVDAKAQIVRYVLRQLRQRGCLNVAQVDFAFPVSFAPLLLADFFLFFEQLQVELNTLMFAQFNALIELLLAHLTCPRFSRATRVRLEPVGHFNYVMLVVVVFVVMRFVFGRVEVFFLVHVQFGVVVVVFIRLVRGGQRRRRVNAVRVLDVDLV